MTAPRISPAEQQDALLKVMMVAPVRALDLLVRVPLLAKERGWPPDGELGYTFIVLAISAYKIGARVQRLRIPSKFLAHERWFALAQQYGMSPTAAVIVEAMDLDELLEPV